MTSVQVMTEKTGRALAGPLLSFDLAAEAAALRNSSVFRVRGHSARTLVKHPDLRLVLIVLKAGACIQQHRTDHRISVQAITGHVRLNLPDQTVDLPAGHALVLDKSILHDVVADEDSTVLLSMSGAPGPSGGGEADDLAQLSAEHRRFSKLLGLMEEQLAKFHRHDRPDYELLRDILYYMTAYPDRFHHPKEDLVFAKVAERIAGARAHVEELHRQHRLIAEVGALFLANLEAALNGTILLREAVEEPALQFIALYRQNMMLEEQQLFPLARTVVSQADWAQAHAAIGTEADPLFGELVEDRYRSLHRWIALAAGCGCQS